MCYASSYYRALHAQVKILATIESELESLSADFNHLVVSSFKNTGNLATNITSFTTSYNAIFNQNTPTEDMVQLLNLNKIVSQKFNQYVSAEQRFLKNIYKFREYFNAPNIFATANGATTLFDVTFTIPTIIDGTFYSLKDGVSYQGVNDDIVIGATTTDEGTIDYSNASFSVQVYEYYNGQYCLRPIVHSKNYTDYYIPQITAGSFIPVSSNHAYNSNNSYYLQ